MGIFKGIDRAKKNFPGDIWQSNDFLSHFLSSYCYQKLSVSVYVLFKTQYLQGVKKFQATPTKQDLGTSEEIFSKFQQAPPILFL